MLVPHLDMELITTLGIDWKLLIVQLLNFLLLIGVLTFLLYRPILRVLDERKERIKQAMEDAKKMEQQRKDLEKWRTEEMKKIDQEAGKVLDETRKQAELMKKEMMENAQNEANQIVEKAKKQLDEERTRMTAEVQGTLAGLVVKLTERVLQREFNSTDQQRIAGDIKKDLPALMR